MAAAGKAGSRKAEKNAFNMGDERDLVLIDEDEEAIRYFQKRFEDEEEGTEKKKRPTVDFKSEKLLKEQKEQEDYLRKKKTGALLVGELGSSSAQQRRKKKTEAFTRLEEADFLERKAKERQAQLDRKRLLKSSAYKRTQWEEKCKKRAEFEEEFEQREKEIQARLAELRQINTRFANQRRIDESWQSDGEDEDEDEQPIKEAAKAKPKPKPKPGGKGAKGKGGLSPEELRRRFGDQADKLLKQKEEKKVKKKLPWSPEKGEKDPLRPAEEKRSDEIEWQRTKKDQEELSTQLQRLKSAFEARKKILEAEGCYAYPLDASPVFETDPESAESSDSGSDSSDSDSD